MSDDVNAERLGKLKESIKQVFYFTEKQCRLIEKHVNDLVKIAECGGFKKSTVDEVPLRKKYFFGEGYIYGHQLFKKGRGMEKLYPLGCVDPIPTWITNSVINPLIAANIIPENFVNSVVINDYLPGGCIVSHIDPPHIFDRPIISLSLFSDSALCFGCKFEFKPIRCTEPVLRLPLPRGVLTFLSDFAANEISHCVRPEDTKYRRAVILLRRVLPSAPRLTIDSPEITLQDRRIHGNYRPEKFIDIINHSEMSLKRYRKKNANGKCSDVSDKIMQLHKVSFKKYSKPIRNSESSSRQSLDKKIFFADNLVYMEKPYRLNSN